MNIPSLVSQLHEDLSSGGWTPGQLAGWTRQEVTDWHASLISAGLKSKTIPLAAVALEIAAQRKPDTVRGIMYAVVSMGWLPDTSAKSYGRIQRLLNTLRKKRVIPFNWIVDNVRQTVKPRSWSGLEDFAVTAAKAYRKDFWSQMPAYVCVVVEKDTVAGRIEPVTRRYDVALHALRGFSSTSFAYEIGEHWRKIKKPIHAYYIGDHDPSGVGIETSLVLALKDYSGRSDFQWKRLAVLPEHFDRFDIRPLRIKQADTRARAFAEAHGPDCAEVEAIPADALRGMVADAIEQHVPADRWSRLQEIENEERASWHKVVQQITGAGR